MSQQSEKQGQMRRWRPAPRAFFVYYVALFLCFFGPLINPEAGLPQWLGILLGIPILILVAYWMYGQEYVADSRGVAHLWRWPATREEIAWEDLGEVQVRRGLTQSLLNVGNLALQNRAGDKKMLWYGLADPKKVKAEIELRRS